MKKSQKRTIGIYKCGCQLQINQHIITNRHKQSSYREKLFPRALIGSHRSVRQRFPRFKIDKMKAWVGSLQHLRMVSLIFQIGEIKSLESGYCCV